MEDEELRFWMVLLVIILFFIILLTLVLLVGCNNKPFGSDSRVIGREGIDRGIIVNNSILVVGEKEAVTQTICGLMLNKNFKPYNTVIIRGKKSINNYETKELKKYSAIFLRQGSIDQNSIFKLEQYVNSGGVLLPDVTKNKNSVSEDEINGLFK